MELMSHEEKHALEFEEISSVSNKEEKMSK
jgi:hypothetical protein